MRHGEGLVITQCKQKGWDGGVILFAHNSKYWKTVAMAAEHKAHLKGTGAENSFCDIL